jgi:hypothetical protein
MRSRVVFHKVYILNESKVRPKYGHGMAMTMALMPRVCRSFTSAQTERSSFNNAAAAGAEDAGFLARVTKLVIGRTNNKDVHSNSPRVGYAIRQ